MKETYRLTRFTFWYAIIILLVLLELLSGCRRETAVTGDKIMVAVTLLPQAGIMESIGGEMIDVMVMVPPGASPHTYEVLPEQMVKLSRAKLYAKVGSPVEFEVSWMEKLIELNKKMLIVDCSQGIDLMEGQDPDEPDPDPHIWLSARNAVTMAWNIYEGLIVIDAAHQDYYYQRYCEYRDRLMAVDREIESNLTGLVNRAFIVFHPAFGYFARDYGLEQISVEQGGKEPDPDYIVRLIREAKERGIKLIFISPQYSPRSAEVIAREIGGKVVIIDPLAKDLVSSLQAISVALRAGG